MLLLRNFITTAIRKICFLAPKTNRANVESLPQTLPAVQETEEQGMHMLDLVCVDEGDYYKIDEWFSETGIEVGNEEVTASKLLMEGISLKKLAKHIRFGTGGVLYDFFTEMKEPGSITSSNTVKLKELLQHKSLPFLNPHPDQGLTAWNKHILDTVFVEKDKYKTIDEFYFDFVEEDVNIGKGIHDEVNLRELAKHIGVGTGGMLYDFIADMDDPESIMSPEFVLDCFGVVKMASSLHPSPKMVNRFWEWFLGGVEAYLRNFKDPKAKIREILNGIIKIRDPISIRGLQARRKGGPISAIDVLYCFDIFVPEFFNFQPADPSIQIRINALMLYVMVAAASLGRIAENFKHLISVPFENSDFLRLNTFDGNLHTKANSEYSDKYLLYIDERDIKELKYNINMTTFWNAVKRQVLLLGHWILEPIISENNNPKGIYSIKTLNILYDVSGVQEKDVFVFYMFAEKSEDFGNILWKYGFTNISRLSINVISLYVGLAEHFYEQLRQLITVIELDLVFNKEFDANLSDELATLKRWIEQMAKYGGRENYNFILGNRGANDHGIKYIPKIEPYGMRFSRVAGSSFSRDPICALIKERQWKDMRFELMEGYAKFMTTLKGVKQEIEESYWESKEVGKHKWKLERFSLELDRRQPVFLISLIRDIGDIMPYAKSLFIRGGWPRIPVPGEKGIAYFKRIKYFECTHNNINSLEDKLQSTNLDPADEAYTPSIKELTVYKMALDSYDANDLAKRPLRKLYLHICPASKEYSLLPIILNLNSKLAKSLKHLTILFWHSTPEDKEAGNNFIKAKEKENVFVSIRYMEEMTKLKTTNTTQV